MLNRGILMHISSLPSPYGIGNLGKESYNFVDFLASSGQSYWQILPQNPTGFGDSPYQSSSAFAGNPYFIDIDTLIEEGLLKKDETDNYFFGDNPEKIDYEKLFFYRFPLLRCAFFRFKPDNIYNAFIEENAYWLEEYALFMALKEQNHYQCWQSWDEKLKNRDEETLSQLKEKLKNTIDFYKFIQFKFFEQWYRLKAYANSRGIKIIGDMPIYVAMDSAETWSERKLFLIDENNNPKRVACLPPDSNFKSGQLWGNPIYNWENMRADDYKWWKNRFLLAQKMYDLIRIDHFCGFFEYYSVDTSAHDAKNFSVHKGPGEDFFDKMKDSLKIDVIAENLGVECHDAEIAMKKYGFFGMNILQFSTDFKSGVIKAPGTDVAYTGNHDTNTLMGWFDSLSSKKQQIIRKILNIKKQDDIKTALIASVLRTDAPIKIIPLQDYLGHSSEKRMNIPSTLGGNWLFRATKEELNENLGKYIKSFDYR